MAPDHQTQPPNDEAFHAGIEHEHPTWKQYKWVALILTLITVVEVWAYYIPSFVASRLFVPALLIMSAVKFAIVVMFYMHLKYDHKLFRALFTGPLIIAMVTIISLLFLFGQLVVRSGATS
jgi:cytochrome c oxidase subunit IV